jgi:hypothetical protein
MPIPQPGDLFSVGQEFWLILKPAAPFVDITHDGRICGWWVWATSQAEQMPPMPIFVARRDLRPYQDTYIQRHLPGS